MRRIIIKLFSLLGYTAAKTTHLKKYNTAELTRMYPSLEPLDVAVLKAKEGVTGLQKQLLDSGRTKWLEIGCGKTFEKNFVYVDIFPEETINRPGEYFMINMTSPDKQKLEKLGKFDLVRMQHVFEHFTPEDAAVLLTNIDHLLNDDGYLLISVPDLEKFIHLYQTGQIKAYYQWALERVEQDAPPGFFFSVYAHSILTEQHKWCYDEEGLKYIISKSGHFYDIRTLKLGDEYASIPFTHNRPVEDLVVLAKKKSRT